MAAARNAAAAVARGQWLTFQDSDDLWTRDHLAIVARDLAAAPQNPEAENFEIVAHLGDVSYVGAGYEQGLFAIKHRVFPKGHAERVADPLPLIDEIVMGLVTLMLATWKKPRAPGAGSPREGVTIDGESRRE